MADLKIDEAIAAFVKFGDDFTKTQFEDLLRQISVEQMDETVPPVAYLYSGSSNPYVRNRLPAATAEALASSGGDQIATINGTHVAEFLSDPTVLAKLLKLFPESTDAAEEVRQYLQTSSTDLTKTGPWGIASNEFTAAFSDDVITFTGLADYDRVFVETELRALMANDNIRTINGIKIGTFKTEFAKF